MTRNKSSPSTHRIHRKGVYEIFTTFIYVIIAVAIVLLALLLSGKITTLKSHASEERIRASLAKEAFDAIVACNHQEIMDESMITECADTTKAKAIMIYQPGANGCEIKEWGKEYFDVVTRDTTTEIFPYWIGVRQDRGNQICLAQLRIAI